MKKTLLLLMALSLLITSFLGCAKDTGLRKVETNEVTRSVFYAPLYVAVTRGFFKEEGMEINITTGGGSDKSMTALLAKEADVALMGPETVVYV
ncbi:MAG: ABC transporter substrate-binding protein, partial [Eubacteriales bacterium]|nr:ABC transporter substrate-binding protein [Eubacteriales bacterium]